MLLRTDIKVRTAWHIAAYWGELDLLQKIWASPEEILTTKVIKMIRY